MADNIEIIYCFRNRDLGRVKRSLDSLALQVDKKFSVLFIDYGSDAATAASIKALCKAYYFCRYEYIDSEGKMWNRSDALNHGIILSQAQHIFTADVDMVFAPDFVSYLHQNAGVSRALFFAVGYLSKKTTEDLDLSCLSKIPYTISKDFALGMALLSKEMFVRINGYNSFYSVWGQEDNDLKYRLEKAGIQTQFVDEKILMFHQFHPPLPGDRKTIPDGWIQFMKDYQQDFNRGERIFPGLSSTGSVNKRPAKALFLAQTIGEFKKVQVRKLYLRHFVIQSLLQAPTQGVLAFECHPLSGLRDSRVVRFGVFLTALFKRLLLPLEVVSSHKSQYLSIDEIRTELFFILKSFEDQISDYYIHFESDHIKLIVVKK